VRYVSGVNQELDKQVCFALYAASRAATARYRPILDRFGLTYPQYVALLVLWERGETTVKDLGAALMLDSGTLSPLLKRLEALGYLTRSRDAQDERSLKVTLTDVGRDVRQQALEVPPAIMAKLGMDGDELGNLHAVLTDVIAHTDGKV